MDFVHTLANTSFTHLLKVSLKYKHHCFVLALTFAASFVKHTEMKTKHTTITIKYKLWSFINMISNLLSNYFAWCSTVHIQRVRLFHRYWHWFKGWRPKFVVWYPKVGKLPSLHKFSHSFINFMPFFIFMWTPLLIIYFFFFSQ